MKKFMFGVTVGMAVIVAVLTQTGVGQRIMSGDRPLVLWESDITAIEDEIFYAGFMEGYDTAEEDFAWDAVINKTF